MTAADTRNSDALHRAGIAALQRGDHLKAIELVRAAIDLSPRQATLHNSLGEALHRAGQLKEARSAYAAALALEPDNLDALNDMGVVLLRLGAMADAISCFERASALAPDSFAPRRNLAVLLVGAGRAAEALPHAKAALATGDDVELRRAFASAIMAAKTRDVLQPDCRVLVMRAQKEGWSRPGPLSRPIAALLRCLPAATLYRDTLLIELLRSAPVQDPALELTLTAERAALLRHVVAQDLDHDWLIFGLALAQQCFLNEYLYLAEEHELALVDGLKDRLEATLASGSQPSAAGLCAVGCYTPLSRVEGAERLLSMPWPKPVTELLRLQISEPQQEQEIRQTIVGLTAIDDRVSRQVQQQYEENPYPRWARLGPPPNPTTLNAVLNANYPLARPTCGAEMLIAGCGTGEQPIEVALQFPGSRILAIDLSRSSLAFAIRKTRELSIPNLRYAQADILELPSLGLAFDSIEATGVLHHMADPFAGWRALLSSLKPDGVMRVALYSETGRRSFESARQLIAERGYGPTSADIRACRQELIGRQDPTSRTPDFFTLSECRDLLFHVQERRFDLPTIARFLAENDLAFLGFELEPAVRQQFQARFPDRLLDLARWNEFEREQPNTFGMMYRFVVQRR